MAAACFIEREKQNKFKILLLSSTACRMALVTICAVPYVARYAAVLRIRLSFCMASRALEDGIIRGIRVTRRAHSVCVAVTRREPCMVENSTSPCSCRMAGLASRRIPGCCMIRICRAVVIGRMTGITSGIAQLIISIRMTERALQRRMRSRERESCSRMIERRAGPVCCRVTGLACF